MLMRFLASMILSSILWACSQPGADGPIVEGERNPGLPPVGRDPAAAEARPALYRDLRQHTHFAAGRAEDPEVSPDGTTLYFASTHDTEDYNLYSTRFESTTVTRLTSSPAQERQPCASPDGRWLAYTSDETGDSWDLYLLSLATPEAPRRLVPGPGHKYGPSWDPTGTRLAFFAFSEQTREFQLWIHDLQTGRSHALDPRIPGLCPRFSPAGDWLAFHKFQGRGPGFASLWILRTDGTEPTEVLHQPGWAAITPAWSPDGTRLAFATVAKSVERQGIDQRADDIWVVEIEKGTLTQITDHPASDWSPVWFAIRETSPRPWPGGPRSQTVRDSRIYFVSDRTGTPNIWSVPAPE